ncbi:hypothetical protein HKX48_001292 [Thoreauomyces humboldtii]|nr:hypothetical protein HKX48_001292 [Thoreauomyces humboldtii]
MAVAARASLFVLGVALNFPSTVAAYPPPQPLEYSRIDYFDMQIRVASLTLMAVNLAAYWLTFKNKHSLVSRLILLFLLSYTVGIIAHMIPKYTVPSNILTYYVGNGCFMLTAQLFNWVLWLRFNLVVPFRHKLRIFTIVWLCLETLITCGIYGYWTYAVVINSMPDKSRIADIYSKFTIVQAISALFMSGYFVKVFYFPKIKDLHDNNRFSFARLMASGILYLFAESLLHLAFLVLFKITPTYYSSLTGVVSAVRYMLFLVFVYQIRDASARSAMSKLSNFSADSSRPRSVAWGGYGTGTGYGGSAYTGTSPTPLRPVGRAPNLEAPDSPVRASPRPFPPPAFLGRNYESPEPSYPAPARVVRGFAQPPMPLSRVKVHRVTDAPDQGDYKPPDYDGKDEKPSWDPRSKDNARAQWEKDDKWEESEKSIVDWPGRFVRKE